jgi:hypothetical protein
MAEDLQGALSILCFGKWFGAPFFRCHAQPALRIARFDLAGQPPIEFVRLLGQVAFVLEFLFSAAARKSLLALDGMSEFVNCELFSLL